MAERLKTFIVVTTLALVVWLFAESESLGEADMIARIEVYVAEQDREELRVVTRDFDGRVTLSIRGAKSSIEAARALLENPIRLQPGMVGIPESNGDHDVRLLEALLAYAPLRASGVTLEAVRPSTLPISIDRLQLIELPIRADISGVRADGDVIVTPPIAEVRVPVSVAAGLEGESAIARFIAEGGAGPAGPRRETVTLELPESLLGAPGVVLLTKRATLEFTVSGTLENLQIPSVPVQVMLPPIEMEDWRVVIDEADQFLSVELRGPRDLIAELERSNQRVVAVVSLS
ncbi:MAG: hypothetical protein AAFX05_11685, partial [Planctomycetota bacterium]